MTANSDSPEGLNVGKNFMVGRFIDGGSFGRLYMGTNIFTKEKVAIKMEKKGITKPLLVSEFAFFKKLEAFGQKLRGIPCIHYFGECGLWNCLVMDLLGPNLSNVHETCGKKYSLKTTILLTVQLFDIFVYFHGKGLISRDIKPENFLFGLSDTDKYNCVYMIDLGLSKEYLDSNEKHIPYVEGNCVTGTVRYMSLNSHFGYEVSRRDDLEAIGYMLVYFLKGELPWMGVKADNTKEMYKQIAKIKQSTKPEVLCADLPKEFATYLSKVKSLKFEEEPKYWEYVNLFVAIFQRYGFKADNVYDFDRNHRKKN